MKGLLVLSTTILFVLPIFSCRNKEGTTTHEGSDTTFVAFKNVENYGNFDVTEKGSSVIESESEWLRLWNRYWNVYDRSGDKVPPPEIDFDKKMVIGIFWGDECKYSGCTNESPSIESVFITHDTLIVHVGKLAPLGNCLRCVHPLHLIELERNDLPVRFLGAGLKEIFVPRDR
ncbi:MAG: hypothetical protein ACE5OP_02610 [Candidatus Glassbacteria bacterium]